MKTKKTTKKKTTPYGIHHNERNVGLFVFNNYGMEKCKSKDKISVPYSDETIIFYKCDNCGETWEETEWKK